jgi:hypothetical protein
VVATWPEKSKLLLQKIGNQNQNREYKITLIFCYELGLGGEQDRRGLQVDLMN